MSVGDLRGGEWAALAVISVVAGASLAALDAPGWAFVAALAVLGLAVRAYLRHGIE